MNTYEIVMSNVPNTKVEGVRFVIDEIGRLLIYKGSNSHASRAATLSEQELVFVVNSGEWVSIEVV